LSFRRTGVGTVEDFPGCVFTAEPLVPIAPPSGRRFMAGWGDCSWCMVTMIAWAADFARRNHDQKILGEMPALLDADGIVKILRLPTLEEPECAASTG